MLGDRVVVFSQRPGRIKQEFAIDLPRPRQIENYAVVDLSREILEVLKDGAGVMPAARSRPPGDAR